MKNWTWYIFSFCLITCFISCQDKTEKTHFEIDITEEIVIPKAYILPKTNSQIIIDGLDNESAWQNAAFTDDFIDIEGIEVPFYKTKVKMMWDSLNLYIYAELEEEHIWGDITERDQIIYLNNDFEVFIDPSMDTHNYGEIEINALGTEWDLFLDKPYSIWGNPIFNWNIKNLQTATHTYGTINDYSDTDSMWTVEMAIPLHALVELKTYPRTLPVNNEIWRINFSRVEWDFEIIDGKYCRQKIDGKIKAEYNWVWSPHFEINMHQPDKWGYIRFSDQDNNTETGFTLSEKSYGKQIAYAAFRKLRFSKFENFDALSAGESLNFTLIVSDKEKLDAKFLKTNFGFEIEFSRDGFVFVINEEGLIKIENE